MSTAYIQYVAVLSMYSGECGSGSYVHMFSTDIDTLGGVCMYSCVRWCLYVCIAVLGGVCVYSCVRWCLYV